LSWKKNNAEREKLRKKGYIKKLRRRKERASAARGGRGSLKSRGNVKAQRRVRWEKRVEA